MEQTPQINFNVIKDIKTIAEKLENSRFKPNSFKSIESPVNKVAIYLQIEVSQAMIFSAIYILDYLGTDVTIKTLTDYILLNSNQIFIVQSEIEQLAKNKIIEFVLPASNKNGIQEQSNIVFKINAKVAAAIKNNTILLTEQLVVPKTIHQFCFAVRELVDSFIEGQCEASQLMIEVEKLEKANDKLSALRQLAEYELRLIDRIILYYMCDVLISWKTGCSLYRSIKPIFENSMKAYLEVQSIKNDESDLVENHLIKVTYSEMIDDYYLELSPDALVLLLIDNPELPIQSLSPNLDSKDPFFKLN